MRRGRQAPRIAYPVSAADMRKARSWLRVGSVLGRVARFTGYGVAAFAAETLLEMYFQGAWYPAQEPDLPPGLILTPTGWKWYGWAAARSTESALPAASGCAVSTTTIWPWCSTSWRRFYSPGVPCYPGRTPNIHTPAFTLAPGCMDPATQFPPVPGPPPAPNFAPPPDPYPWRNPSKSRRTLRPPKPVNVPEVVIEIKPDTPSVVVRPNPQTRPPRGVNETKMSSKGRLASLIWWVWEAVDDSRDWIDILTESAGGDMRDSMFDKIRNMADPAFWLEIDPALLARLAAEWAIEEKFGAWIGDIESKLAAQHGQPISVGWSVNSGGNWGLDNEFGGSVVSEAFAWLDAVANEYFQPA